MTKLTGFLFLLGVALVGGAGMMAFDTYMSDDRKEAVRAEINTQLDEGAARTAERHEDGCRRRCGFFGSMATMITGLRDGVFAGLPFDPETAFPAGPKGWTITPYDLAAVEAIVDWKMQRTPLISPTQNKLLMRMDDIAQAAETGAVRIYVKEDMAIAVAIQISREGLRGEAPIGQRVTSRAMPSSAVANGVPFKVYPPVAYDVYGENPKPVGYRHFVMDLDGQVYITALALAPDEEIHKVLSTFDLTPIIADLPRKPAGYLPRTQTAASAEGTQPTN
jgi:hypothetical protein